MSILADHRDLDWALEIVVIVAQMVGAGLKLIFGQISGIIDHSIKHRFDRTFMYSVSYKIEVIESVSLILNKCCINYGTVARILKVII